MSNSANNTIKIPTSQGEAIATRDSARDPWHIQYPWGDDRFYGSMSETATRMQAHIDRCEAEEAKL